MESPLNRKERKKLNDTLADVLKRFENIQRQVNNLVVEGDSSPEAAQARIDADGKIYRTLKERLDTEQNNKADASDLLQTNELLHKKASIEYVDQIVQGLTGGPAGVYDTLALLQAAFPTGNDKVYVVKEDGKWYYYDTAWKAGGDYQNTQQVTELQKTVETLCVNLLDNGDFSNGLEGWETILGSPTLDTVNFRSYPQSVNVNSTTGARLKKTLSFKVGHQYYIAAYVKCTRRESGTLGIQVVGSTSSIAGKTTVTANFERVSMIYTSAAETANIFVGSTVNANLDGNVDDVVVIDLTTVFGLGKEPDKSTFELLLDRLFPNETVQASISPLKQLIKLDEVTSKTQVTANNLLTNGDFSDSLTRWVVNSGTPTIDTTTYYSPTQSLKVNSTGTSTQVRRDITIITGHKYYVTCVVNCKRYVTGAIGLQLVDVSTNTVIDLVASERVTDGYERLSTIFNANFATLRLFVGGLRSADLDGNIDDVILIDLTSMFGSGYEPSIKDFENILYKDDQRYFSAKNLEISTLDLYKQLNSLHAESVPTNEAINAFVVKMNEKAQVIGMKNSIFKNPHGLAASGEQLSTARDLLKLGIVASGYAELSKCWNKKSYIINIEGDNARQVTIDTSVADAALDNYYYVFGGKTGTLSDVGYETKNLLSIVNAPNGRWFVGVVLKADNRFAESKALFDIAQRALSGENVSNLNVTSRHAAVALVPQNNALSYEGYEFDLLYAKNEDTQTYPASITKVINAVTALDYIVDIHEKVKVVATDITSGTENIFMAGDVITYKDLLYAMMLPSSNTAATAMARLIGTKILSY